MRPDQSCENFKSKLHAIEDDRQVSCAIRAKDAEFSSLRIYLQLQAIERLMAARSASSLHTVVVDRFTSAYRTIAERTSAGES